MAHPRRVLGIDIATLVLHGVSSTGAQPRVLGLPRRRGGRASPPGGPGARATLRWSAPKQDERRHGLPALRARRGQNCAAGAGAQQNARMLWALLTHHQASRARTAVSAQES